MNPPDIDSQLRNASDALEGGDPRRAAACYENVLELDPGNHEACLMLGSLLAEAGMTDRAIELLEKAGELDTDDGTPYLILGHLYRAHGRLDDAVASLEKAAVRNPDDPETLGTYGSALLEKGRGNEAKAAFISTTELDPGNVQAWSALGTLHVYAAEHDEAAAAFSKARELGDPDPELPLRIARALCEADRPDEAEAVLTASLQDYPDSAVIHDNLASVALQQGDIAAAREHNELARGLAPGDPRHIARQAGILEATGDIEDAFNLLKPLLESVNPPVEAILAFSGLSYMIGMTDKCRFLLEKARGSHLPDMQLQEVNRTLVWLDTV